MGSHRLKAYLLLLIVTVIWGVASPVIKYTLAGFDALTFLTYRFFISSLVAVVAFMFIGWHIPKDKKVLLQMLLYGFLTSSVSLGLLFFGMENTTVLDTTLITLINPLIISAAGVYFLNEHVTKKEKIGMGIAGLGTVLTVIEPLIQNSGSPNKLSGNLLILCYVFVTAYSAVLAKKLLRYGVKPLTMTGFSFLIGFLTLIPFRLALGQIPLIINIVEASIPHHLGVWYMALLSGSLAYYLSNRAQKTIEVGESAVFSYLFPIFSAPLAVFWLKEAVTPIFLSGTLIIALGVVVAEIKRKRVV